MVLLDDEPLVTASSAMQIVLDRAARLTDYSRKIELESNVHLHSVNFKSNRQTPRVVQNASMRPPADNASGAKQKSLLNSPAATITKTSSDKASISSYSPCKPKSVERSTSKPSAASKHIDKSFETSDDTKYKVPCLPTANSACNSKIRRHSAKLKARVEICMPVNMTEFPSVDVPAQIVEAPTFYPNDKEFQDPIEYIEKIRQRAEKFGICRIIPPNNFKPECKVSDDMRFTAYNQYVHKMLYRWGPNFKELEAIRKYLKTQNISLTQPPWVCLISYSCFCLFMAYFACEQLIVGLQ